MSNAVTDGPVKVIKHLYQYIEILEPLLEHEVFVLSDTRVGGTKDKTRHSRGAMQAAVRAGAIKKVERVHRGGGDWRWKYRWTAGAREQLRAYLDAQETLPKCGCRVHIPDRRDAPEGRVECKYCGEEYDREWFMGFVEDKL